MLAVQRADLSPKISPIFSSITSAIDELAKLKKEDILKQSPTILMGEEFEKFDDLLKKIQNHRELAKQYLDQPDDKEQL